MQYYRIEVGISGLRSVTYVNSGAETKVEVQGKAVVTPFGTLNNNNDIDEGAVYEITIPKSLVVLRVRPRSRPVLHLQIMTS